MPRDRDDDRDDPPRPRRRDRDWEEYDRDDDYRDVSGGPLPPFPASVTTAGIGWIVFGGFILVNLAVILVTLFAASNTPGVGVFGGAACLSAVIGLFGAAFLFVGVQSVRGTARDTLGNGVGSIIFGLLNAGSGVMRMTTGDTLQMSIGYLCGVGLIVAGVLALVGRAPYKEWRRAKRGDRDRRRRDDYDDRPRQAPRRHRDEE